jgi:GMP synthase-like glutamine amidotransferase
MPRIVALTHIECEGLGWWDEFCHECAIAVDRVQMNDGDPLPDLDRYDGVFVLGGPMDVDEHEKHPWLVGEKAAIKRTAESGKPIIGICLGAQLLARALGADVTRNPVREIGWHLVTLTHEGASTTRSSKD